MQRIHALVTKTSNKEISKVLPSNYIAFEKNNGNNQVTIIAKSRARKPVCGAGKGRNISKKNGMWSTEKLVSPTQWFLKFILTKTTIAVQT